MKGEEQNIDRAFFHCLKEIEISYTPLPKIIRLRIEKWVEKFIIVGSNLVWKKNRNMYAKLLLSMIISKSLSDPFHISPVEGEPLPPFPSYLIPKFKSALGPHESYFWRNIFDRVHEPALQMFSPTPPPPPPPQEPYAAAPSPSYVKLDPNQKETYNLRLLMKEQSRRVELMEEQMQQERLKHQRDMHQVLEQTQDETNRIKEMYRHSQGDRNGGHSYRNDSITSSNPYEIYDGNTTYGGSSSSRRPASPQRSPMKFHLGTTSPDRRHLHASYLPQGLSERPPPGIPFSKPSNNSFIPESKYQQHHNPHSKYSESYLHQNPMSSTNPDYSIGIPVFTPGKEDSKTGFVDSSSQQKAPLRSASKNVYFEDNKHDIKPLSFVDNGRSGSGSGSRETKDLFPPPQRSRGDIAPNKVYSETSRGRYPSHDINTSYDLTQPHVLIPERSTSPHTHSNTPVKKSPNSPFIKDNLWPDYQNDDFSTENDTTYERAKSTVNRRDSNVAPILKRDVPEDEGEFMNYLEDFQKEIRHLQFNTSHNKNA